MQQLPDSWRRDCNSSTTSTPPIDVSGNPSVTADSIKRRKLDDVIKPPEPFTIFVARDSLPGNEARCSWTAQSTAGVVRSEVVTSVSVISASLKASINALRWVIRQGNKVFSVNLMTDVSELLDVLKGSYTVLKSDQSALMTLRHLIQDFKVSVQKGSRAMHPSVTIAKENDIFPQIVQAKAKPLGIMGSPQPRPPLVSLFPLTLVQNKQAPPPPLPKHSHHPLPVPKLPFKVKTASSPAALFSMFIKLWKTQKRYSWCLCYRSLVKEQVIASAAKIAGLSDEEQFLFLPSQHIVKGIAVSWVRDTVYYISLENSNPEATQEIEARWAAVKEVLTMKESSKILWDMKCQLKLLLSHDIKVEEGLLDPRIAAWVIQPDKHKDTTMDEMYDVCRETNPTLPLVSRLFEKYAASNDPLLEFNYFFVKTFKSLVIMNHLEPMLDAEQVNRRIFSTLEMPLVPLLARMEFYGVGFLSEKFDETRHRMEVKADYLERRAYRCAKREFEIGSTKELAYILFEELRLPYPGPSTKGGPSRKSTDKEVLGQLTHLHPLPDVILEYRKLTNAIAKYISPLPKFSYYNESMKMHRVHATCLQTGVPTGRMAFENPNLQCIRHSFDYIPIPEKATSDSSLDKSSSSDSPETPSGPPIEVNIRNSFIPAPGMAMLSADYCQIELRVMAHFSGDPTLKETLQNAGDIFTLTAARLLNKHPDLVTHAERSHTKSTCYGLLYGKGEAALAKDLGTSRDKAKEFKQRFMAKFPWISKFMDYTMQGVLKTGYTETLLGRRRYHYEIYSNSSSERARAERQAINSLCQGTAADIVKTAMIQIDAYVKESNSKARLLINIHDELLFEVPFEELAELQSKIRQIMESCVSLDVPLPVKIRAGPSWGSLVLYENYVPPTKLDLISV